MGFVSNVTLESEFRVRYLNIFFEELTKFGL
jgi:hypothetical protein